MITKVIIKDVENTPVEWCKKVFKGGEEFSFTPEVNIIIGENGSGKSTLLKLIASYMLCHKSLCSEFNVSELGLVRLFWEEFGNNQGRFHDGVDVFADYALPLFNLRMAADINDYEFADNIHNFQLKMNGMRSSTGESTVASIQALFKHMFSDKAPNKFPLNTIEERIGKSNEVWTKRLTELLEYYKGHDIPEAEKTERRVTILLDEPDRNLSIKYAKDILNVLKSKRPDTQIIAVIHNPVLISKLAKTNHVNIIELTPGYLKEVTEWVLGC